MGQSYRVSRSSRLRSFRLPVDVDAAVHAFDIEISSHCQKAILRALKPHLSKTVLQGFTRSVSEMKRSETKKNRRKGGVSPTAAE